MECPGAPVGVAFLLLLTVTLLAPSCTFDRSGLADKLECLSASDCPDGRICVGGRCVADIDARRPYDVGDLLGTTDAADGGGDVALDGDLPDAEQECPGEENPCGGCESLPATPGDPCGGGVCGQGFWACASANTLRCVSDDDTLNACGGCAELDAEPGTSCEPCGEWRCSEDGEALECVGPEPNVCGGCTELDAEPDDPCGACGDGAYACTSDGEAVVCVGATIPNACGGCTRLPAELGDPCRVECGEGVWGCAGTDALRCASDSPSANACGGCTPLEAEPGDPCGVCGEQDCAADGESVVCDDPGPNACGGCEPLDGAPNQPCGVCDDGTTTCVGSNELTCNGATPPNACGGCGDLAGVPEAICGPCEDGVWTCTLDRSAVTCEGASARNACEGCGELVGEPETACGPCNDGLWKCTPDRTAVTCEGASALNACAGCGELEAEPETICGPCDDGIWKCTPDRTAVTCEGASERNACEGCGPLSGNPGEVCSCAGLGDATWDCGETDVVCLDNDDTWVDPVILDDVIEGDVTTETGWLDRVDDQDWYRIHVEDDVGRLRPLAELVSSAGLPPDHETGVNYEVCVFYEYDGNPDIAEGNDSYSCGNSDRCVFFDGSTNAVVDGDCDGVTGFDSDHDRYGCCEVDYGVDGFDGWAVQLRGVDPFGAGDQSGTTHILVRTTHNRRPAGCDLYSLDISF